MKKPSQKIKSKKIKDFLREGKNLSNIDISSLNKSFPEGFLVDNNGYNDHIVSLSYRGKRIAIFNSTKIVVEKINNRIKEFQRNRHKNK